jgi:hypothetical protein
VECLLQPATAPCLAAASLHALKVIGLPPPPGFLPVAPQGS